MNPIFENSEKRKSSVLSTVVDCVPKRRKTTIRKVPVNIDLITFIESVFHVLNTIDDQRQYEKTIESLINQISNKNQTSISKITNTYYLNLSEDEREKLCLEIIIAINENIDNAQIECKFSVESLKYFLATHKQNIAITDFNVSNNIVKNNKGSVNNKDLLNEYCKSINQFIGALSSKCDNSDYMAIKLIIENNLSVPLQIYDFMSFIQLNRTYKEDELCTNEDYCKIPITTTKRSYMIITKYVKIVFNGVSFSMPQPLIERDFKLLNDDCQNSNYIILDVLNGAKTLIIDIVSAQYQLPDSYIERLGHISKKYGYSVVTPITSNEQHSGSYIYIAKSGLSHPVYIYNKLVIAAIVGRKDKQAIIAYSDGNNNLIYKNLTDIISPMNIVLLTKRTNDHAKINDGIEPYYEILLNGESKKLYGIKDTDVKLYYDAILVSMKDSNKLGIQINHGIVSNINEIQMPITKEPVFKITELIKDERNRKEIYAAILNSIFRDEFRAEILNNMNINLTNI